MNIASLNPEFSGLGVVTPRPPQILSLYAEMPFGKHKGSTIAELIEEETSYMRWFVDNVDRYVLSPEAFRALSNAESTSVKYHDDERRELNFDEDIPW
jgi:hypothetical protein